jgi:hypothetical protein
MNEMIIEISTVAMCCVLLFLQGRNFLKYKKVNGANTVRILVFASTLCSAVHSVMFLIGNPGIYFFTGAVFSFSLIYLINPE